MANTILITGTSSGIGRSTALVFQRHGWNGIASMRSPERETELTQLENTLVVRIDVTDEASIGPALEQGIRAFGSIEVLVNNAGYGAYGLIEATAIEHMRREFETEYGHIVRRTMATFEKLQQHASDADSVAETIYRAATDGTPQLRYPSGKDAEQMLKLRKTEGDAAFTERVRKLFDLNAPEPAGD